MITIFGSLCMVGPQWLRPFPAHVSWLCFRLLTIVLNAFTVCSLSNRVLIVSNNSLCSSATCLQMSLDVMFPVEWLATQRAGVAANFGMPWVGVCLQVRLIEKATPTDVAEVFIGTRMQPLVLDVARVWEQCFPARFTRLVRSQFWLGTWRYMWRKRLHCRHVKCLSTDAWQFVCSWHQHAINRVWIVVCFIINSAFC